MDLKERLLQNEIQNLGQIIQTLSYELILLQDFMKEEYGKKFEAFRNKYSSETETNSDAFASSSTLGGPSSKESKSKSLGGSLGRPKLEVPCNEDNPIDGLNDLDRSGNDPEDDGSCFSSDGVYSDDEIANEAKALKDPLETESEKKGGRKKMKIWKYFETVKLRNGKFSAKCHLCSNLISARAPRMVEHRIKCSRMSAAQRAAVKKGRPRKKGIDSALQRLKQEDSDNDNSSTNINNTEDTIEKESLAIETSGEHSSSQKTATTIGRHPDLIWAYFTIIQKDNLKKAKCIACGQIVSPKAGRMRIHKSVCQEVSTAETHSSPSLLASGDDSNNNT